MDTVTQETLTKTTLKRKGAGTAESPVRILTQYWDHEGALVFEKDPCAMTLSVEFIHALNRQIEAAHHDLARPDGRLLLKLLNIDPPKA